MRGGLSSQATHHVSAIRTLITPRPRLLMWEGGKKPWPSGQYSRYKNISSFQHRNQAFSRVLYIVYVPSPGR